MAPSDELQMRVNAALLLAQSGNDKAAEKALLEVAHELGDDEAAYRGKLYLNLGSLAQNGGRLEDALRYNAEAYRQLEDLKGESILQSAHACFNIARILLESGAEAEAPQHATLALERYQRYPLTSSIDLLDAEILKINCQVYASSHSGQGAFPKTPDEMKSLWQSILSHPFAEFEISGLQRFLLIYLPLKKELSADEFKKDIQSLKNWADPGFVKTNCDLMNQKPGIILLSPNK